MTDTTPTYACGRCRDTGRIRGILCSGCTIATEEEMIAAGEAQPRPLERESEDYRRGYADAERFWREVARTVRDVLLDAPPRAMLGSADEDSLI